MPTLDYALDEATLTMQIREGATRAARVDRPILVSHTAPLETTDPLTLLLVAQALNQPAFFWQQPEREHALAGFGAAYRIETRGAERFTAAARQWQRLLEDALIDAPAVRGAGPLLLGGFSFDPARPRSLLWEDFADGSLVLPRVQLSSSAGRTLLTVNLLVDGATDAYAAADESLRWATMLDDLPLSSADDGLSHARVEEVLPAAVWQELARAAIGAIAEGALDKVVLARAVRLSAARPFSLDRAIRRLRESYSNACTFAITRGARCFLGATPERLVAVEDGIARTAALAGTIRRGATAHEDQLLQQRLLDSVKDRHEHALVVETLRTAFAASCDDVRALEQPEVLRLSNVQHLHTPISGRLRPGHSLLDLLARLHPTPAVGGLPRAAALRYLRDHEQLDRGWYAAPVGWLDAHGAGEFVVALRSGVIDGAQATLFAGCGIVAGSDPVAEYEETRLKLRPMLEALGLEG